MTINLTHPTDTEPDVTTVRRANYMTALSLAEQILSETTAIPTNFSVATPHYAPDEPSLRFHFHRNPDALREFATERSMSVTTTIQDNGYEYTEATGALCRGVRVEAWSLVSAEAAAATADTAEVLA